MNLSARTRLARLMIAAALGAACAATPALASPGSQVASSQAALDRAVEEYEAVAKRLSAVEKTLADNSARLDEMLVRQTELETRLSARASSMYRAGPFSFLTVLVGSATFDQFLTVWDGLVRFNRQDDDTLRQLRRARAEVRKSSVRLLAQQEEASRRLRALEAAKTKAARALAEDQAARAAYEKRIAEQEALRAARARAEASKKTASAAAVSQKLTGAGAWRTAVASHYGPGSYGTRLSSGVVIGPDSMIVAHKTLAFGTLVEFSYKGRTAVAKVADRGPYTPGRVFDLGPGTTRVLGFRGVDEVEYRIIGR